MGVLSKEVLNEEATKNTNNNKHQQQQTLLEQVIPHSNTAKALRRCCEFIIVATMQIFMILTIQHDMV